MSIFDHAHQKTIESTFSFPESVPTYKNQFIPLVYFGDRANFIVPWPDLPHLFFLTMPTQKMFDQLLIFVNLDQHAKNQLFHLFIPQIVNFGVPSRDWPHPDLTKPSPKIFNHLLICMNLYQHVKNLLIPSVHSWDIVNFRVQRLDWSNQFLDMPN